MPRWILVKLEVPRRCWVRRGLCGVIDVGGIGEGCKDWSLEQVCKESDGNRGGCPGVHVWEACAYVCIWGDLMLGRLGVCKDSLRKSV